MKKIIILLLLSLFFIMPVYAEQNNCKKLTEKELDELYEKHNQPEFETKLLLRRIASHIAEYYMNYNRLPPNIEIFNNNVYRPSPILDYWGNPVIYKVLSPVNYRLISTGADGKLDSFQKPCTRYDEDIIFYN